MISRRQVVKAGVVAATANSSRLDRIRTAGRCCHPASPDLPAARNIPSGYARVGSLYDQFAETARQRWGVRWRPGSAIFVYPNDQPAGTNWYHDHALGMTRNNVYSGLAAYYLLRGRPSDDHSGKDDI